MTISTKWMPEREMVAAHAHHSIGALEAVADDDEPTALGLAYGNAEAAVVYIRNRQSAAAAIALLEVFIAALREPVPANGNERMPTVILQ